MSDLFPIGYEMGDQGDGEEGLKILVNGLLRVVLPQDAYWSKMGHMVRIYDKPMEKGKDGNSEGWICGTKAEFESIVPKRVIHWDSGETFTISKDGLSLFMETWGVEDEKVEKDVYCEFFRLTREGRWEIDIFVSGRDLQKKDVKREPNWPLCFIRDYLFHMKDETFSEDGYYWDLREDFSDPEPIHAMHTFL